MLFTGEYNSQAFDSTMSSRPPDVSSQSRSPAASRRVERSCVICHRRKVRCDKQAPCSQCSRGGYTCLYPQTGPPVRRVRKTTITDVASRISELEKTLIAVSREHEVQLSIRPSSNTNSSHVVASHTTSPTFEPRPRRTESEAADESPSDEILLKKGTSSQYFNEVLFSRVIEQVRCFHAEL